MPPSVPLPSRAPTLTNDEPYETVTQNDQYVHVHPSWQDEENLADLHRSITVPEESGYPEPHSALDKYLKTECPREVSGKPLGRLGVCYKNVTTLAEKNEHLDTKTFGDALWRTLTFQDIYEWTIKRWVDPPMPEHGRPLLRDFSGVVRSGEILL